jgi:transcriptional regulator with AAA-type ATPase domain
VNSNPTTFNESFSPTITHNNVESEMLSLSDEQCNILNAAVNGHNVFITGQGGTGKSFLAKEIYKQLTLGGKKMAIVCSTGIACKAYKKLQTRQFAVN